MGTIDLWNAVARHAAAEKNKTKQRERKERNKCLKEGQVINGYEVGSFCGRGGIGELIHAMHIETGKRMVLKYPRPGMGAICDVVKVFKREAEFLRELDHPNIVRGYAAFQHKGITYLPMENLDNNAESFFYTHNRFNKQYLSKLYFFMSHAVKALKYIHSKGIVHCDITPSQFMVLDEIVKLADLGSAKRTGEPTLRMMVTPGFTLSRFPCHTDPCIDIYSMGRTITRVILPTLGLGYQDCRDIMRQETDQQLISRLRKAHISEYLVGNIIESCLEATEPGKGIDAEKLEKKIDTFGTAYDVQDRVRVRVELYTGKMTSTTTPTYKTLMQQ